MNKQENTAQTKQQDKLLETNPNETEVCESPDREFKITIYKKAQKAQINKMRISTDIKIFKE
jgi:hypothetical protein